MHTVSESPVDHTRVLTQLQNWIERVRPDIGRIAAETDLIEERVIDSLQFMNFIAYVEELRGASIQADDIDMDHFRTLSVIVNKFF